MRTQTGWKRRPYLFNVVDDHELLLYSYEQQMKYLGMPIAAELSVAAVTYMTMLQHSIWSVRIARCLQA